MKLEIWGGVGEKGGLFLKFKLAENTKGTNSNRKPEGKRMKEGKRIDYRHWFIISECNMKGFW